MLKLILWLIIMPFLAGLLPIRLMPGSKQNLGVTFISGYLLSFGLFEVVTIPCMMMIQYNAFEISSRIDMILDIILVLVSVALSIIYVYRKASLEVPIKGKEKFSKADAVNIFTFLFPGEIRIDPHDFLNPRSSGDSHKERYSFEGRILWILFAAIVAFQLYMAFTRASFDGDDSYYVTESLLAQQTGVMNTILPYTGLSTSLDIRHALAVITMWIAYIAKMSGIHSTIISHSVIPLIMIPLVYTVYIEIGRILFKKRQDLLPVFMIIMAVLQMFGNTSIYTSETFFLTRTWQGKALVANLVVPLILWVFMWLGEQLSKETGSFKELSPKGKIEACSPFMMLFLINMTAGICSSMGVILGTVLIGLLTFVYLIAMRKIRLVPGVIIACLPNLIYVCLYLSVIG